MPKLDLPDGPSVFRKLLENTALAVRLKQANSAKSKIGGRPNLREGAMWPSWQGKPQAFLAQLDLEEVRQASGPEWLPDRGTLYFFYDSDQGTWGFSTKDRGSWTVLFDASREPLPAMPRGPNTPDALEYPEQALAMELKETLPTPERLGIDLADLSDQALDELDAADMAFDPDFPCHQIGGWPRPIQNDHMELECQLASNGIDCGDAGAYQGEAARASAPGASEWRLLLQLDSDDVSDMMWGDLGRLYFWIRERDARAGDFTNVWMILQCS